jgi:tetratricopeptide (TPR) repeat protein
MKRPVVLLTSVALVFLVVLGVVLGLVVFRNVCLVNGLAVPITVEVDGRRLRVPPIGRTWTVLRIGTHDVRASTGKDVVEDATIVAPPSSSVVLYNVMGVAPVYEASVFYSKGGGRDPNPLLYFFGGRRLIVLHDHIDYQFEPLPESIQVDNNSSGERKLHLDTIDGGWRATVGYLMEHGRDEESLSVCRGVVAAQPEDASARSCVEQELLRLRGPQAVLNMLEQEIKTTPNDADAHKSYLRAAWLLGHGKDIQRRYRALCEREPTPLNCTLRARTEESKEAIALLRDTVARWPEDGFARRTLAYLAFLDGDYALAATVFEDVATRKDPEYRAYLNDHASSLVALGRAQEAADRVARLLSSGGELQRDEAVLYSRLARLPGVKPPVVPATFIERLASASENQSFRPWLWSLTDADVSAAVIAAIPDPELRDSASIHMLSGRDPDAARHAYRLAPAGARRKLVPVVAMLMAARVRPRWRSRYGRRAVCAGRFGAHGLGTRGCAARVRADRPRLGHLANRPRAASRSGFRARAPPTVERRGSNGGL